MIMDIETVINLICKDDNSYFTLGISEIIREAMLSKVNINFLTSFDSESMKCADFILISSSQWRLFVCQTAFRYRKLGCVLLVFMDDADAIKPATLPICYQSLTVISRQDSVRKVREKIIQARSVVNHSEARIFLQSDCIKCNLNKLSMVQLQIMGFLKRGKSVRQIAAIMGLSPKTIYAHKYNSMKKFNLKREHELYLFLNELSLSQMYYGIIDEVILKSN